MTLIDGDKLVTAQLYDDEHEEFKEEQMSIIDYVNAYTTEGVTTADDVLEQIKAEIIQIANQEKFYDEKWALGLRHAVKIIDKHMAEESENEE